MTNSYIKQFIGKKIKVIFYDDTFACGTLGFNNHPFKKNIYDLNNGFNVEVYFRKSHIKNIEVIE